VALLAHDRADAQLGQPCALALAYLAIARDRFVVAPSFLRDFTQIERDGPGFSETGLLQVCEQPFGGRLVLHLQ
jgi:hypothetical protein